MSEAKREFFHVVLVFYLNLPIHLAWSSFSLPGTISLQAATLEWGWSSGIAGQESSGVTLGEHRDIAWFRDPGLRSSLPLHAVQPGARDSACLGSSFFLCDTKSLEPGVLHSALKKLPCNHIIKTRAQEGIWNKAGSVAGSPRQPRAGTGALGQWAATGPRA